LASKIYQKYGSSVLAKGDTWKNKYKISSFVIPHGSIISVGRWNYAVIIRGDLYMAGGNVWGQLGTGNFKDQEDLVQISLPSKVINISCGTDFTGAVTVDGKVFLWGANNDYMINSSSSKPVTLVGRSNFPKESQEDLLWR
jgi:alpha-tubulin suppressor-like RCC1 family protein